MGRRSRFRPVVSLSWFLPAPLGMSRLRSIRTAAATGGSRVSAVMCGPRWSRPASSRYFAFWASPNKQKPASVHEIPHRGHSPIGTDSLRPTRPATERPTDRHSHPMPAFRDRHHYTTPPITTATQHATPRTHHPRRSPPPRPQHHQPARHHAPPPPPLLDSTIHPHPPTHISLYQPQPPRLHPHHLVWFLTSRT
jgi:hypothetical protein